MTLQGLRIVLVGPLPPPAGGMANQTRQLAELLRSDGAAVDVVQTNPAYAPAWVGKVKGLRAVFRLVPYVARLLRAAGRNDVMHLMANSGWSWHLFAAPAIWVANLRGLPVVVNYRGGEAEGFLARSAALVRASLSRAAALVVPSGFLQAVFARHGIPSAVVPNIVDLHRFRPGSDAQADRVMVARNLEPIYDNETALRALALLQPRHTRLRMTIAGTGPEEARLKALALELGIAGQVDFAGRLDRDEMAEQLRRSRVALNPSRVDNMPNSVLEALASGVPVVSTQVGGVPYIVEHERTALLVPPGDAQAMADALHRVLTDPGLAREMALQGLQEAQRYTWGRVSPLLIEHYRACMAGRTRTVVS